METSRSRLPRVQYCYISGFITITMSYHINEKLLKMLFEASRPPLATQLLQRAVRRGKEWCQAHFDKKKKQTKNSHIIRFN